MKAIEKVVPEQSQVRDRDVVLSVNNVSKRFCRDLKRSLLYGVQDMTSDLLGFREESHQLRPKEFWALKDVSFQLRRGEALGLVGKNGSGKSTLLRIIAGLIKPDAGSVNVKGRVAPLIALGAGFNPILTGRENIYANMSILGLSKEEIDQRFDRVVEFAEIGDAIDSPVQTYSSGMAARLGFASAIHTEPEILLIDEVLAVGDIRFRQKCHRRLAKLREKGVSFILVAHNSQVIFTSCKTAVYLSGGKLVDQGSVSSIINQYERDLFVESTPTQINCIHLPAKSRQNSYGLDITSLFFKNSAGKILQTLMTGMEMSFCVKCQAHQKLEQVNLYLLISEQGGEGDIVLSIDSAAEDKFFTIHPGTHELQIKMPFLCLKPGVYIAKIIIKQNLLSTLDFVESFHFVVESQYPMNRSAFYQPRSWDIVSD
ncbi:polysaccharide ABC transporter ATP-binding protein [Leptolyngbya sp. AN03gr2]|uniref:ABC transporter ATP-binding protein n=1 Tax=unclassified Leptolyngbya TaxID=2650499 RepID=UPI003D322C27